MEVVREDVISNEKAHTFRGNNKRFQNRNNAAKIGFFYQRHFSLPVDLKVDPLSSALHSNLLLETTHFGDYSRCLQRPIQWIVTREVLEFENLFFSCKKLRGFSHIYFACGDNLTPTPHTHQFFYTTAFTGPSRHGSRLGNLSYSSMARKC